MRNKALVLMLNDAIRETWQITEQRHLSRTQMGLINDIRQLELFRNYLETLC